MEITGAAKALEAAGRDVCHLEVGEPGAPPAPAVLRGGRRGPAGPAALHPFAGPDRAARWRWPTTIAASTGSRSIPSAIVVTMGSSSGFILAFLGGVRAGSEDRGDAAGLSGLSQHARRRSAMRAVEIPLTAADRLAADAARTSRRPTRGEPFDGLLFASPANPTGAAVTGRGLGEHRRDLPRLGVRLISDEIYHGLDYRGPSVSALELTPRRDRHQQLLANTTA